MPPRRRRDAGWWVVSAATPGACRRAAVLGSPIAHSLSPVLHRAAYAQLGLDWRYDAIECDERALPALLERLDADVIGLSLTMPLKRAVLALLDEPSSLVREVGAANTVLFDAQRRLRGENTDVAGMVGAVSAVRADDRPLRSAAILGAGGTAAAAVAACRDLGIGEVVVVVRDRARAAELVGAAGRLGVPVSLADWPGGAVVAAADLVVSTVPAGAADELAGRVSLSPEQLLFDVVYDPWPSRLATAAAIAGAQVVGGLELLVRQAALQVELMTGRPAPLVTMRAAGLAAIEARTGARSGAEAPRGS